MNCKMDTVLNYVEMCNIDAFSEVFDGQAELTDKLNCNFPM